MPLIELNVRLCTQFPFFCGRTWSQAGRNRLQFLCLLTKVPPNVYLERLVTKEEEETQRRPPMPSNVLSMAELRTMTLSDQIKALITNAKVRNL